MRKSAKTKDAEPALFQTPHAAAPVPKQEVMVAPPKASPPPAKPRARAPLAKRSDVPGQENVLQIIARAAADPAVQPEKMRALLDMQKEIMAEEARRAFTRDFIAMQDQLPAINKDAKIEIPAKPGKTGGTMPYSSYNEINRVTKPILREHGFVLSSSVTPGSDGRVIVHTTLDHVGGHFKPCAIDLPVEASGSKNNVQGVGSSISYGRRYGAIVLLNLISEAPQDRDRDGRLPSKDEDGPDLVGTDELTQITAACRDADLSHESLLTFINGKMGKNHTPFEAITEFPKALLPRVLTAIAAYRSAKAARDAAGAPAASEAR